MAVDKLERALTDGVSFTQETTLSGGYTRKLARRAKDAGYYIRLYYIGLDTAQESLLRTWKKAYGQSRRRQKTGRI